MSARSPLHNAHHIFWDWHCNACCEPLYEPREYDDWYDGPLWMCPSCLAKHRAEDKRRAEDL